MTEEHKAAIRAARSSENKTIIPINNQWQIYAVDERNWAIQKNVGTDPEGNTIWVSKYFYNKLNTLLRELAAKILNKELRYNGSISDIMAVAKLVEAAQEKVIAVLSGIVEPSIDLDEEDEAEQQVA